MQFADLEVFWHVARSRSFSGAAASLRVAQSALSRRVARLEGQLGLKLFVRHGRGISLTPEGEALAAKVEGLVQEMKGLSQQVREMTNEPSGKVVVAFTPTSGRILGPKLLTSAARFSRLTIEIREGFSGSVHNWLQEGTVDVALLYEPEQAPELEIVPLLVEPLNLVGAPAQIDALPKGPFPQRKLGTIPLILPSRSHSMRRLVDRYAIKSGVQLNIRNQVDGMRTISGIMEEGLGFTITTYAGVHDETEAGTLKMKPLQPPLQWVFSMVFRKDEKNSSAIRMVREVFSKEIVLLVKSGLWQGKVVV